MKYKVGDKVVVRKDLKIGTKYGGDMFVADMNCDKGKQVTISKVINNDYKYYKIEESVYRFTDEMFEDKNSNGEVNMKELRIKVKFTNEDVVYTTKITKEEKICNFCNGEKIIEYHGETLKCPKCNGIGVIKSNKQVHVVIDEPYKITRTKISIGANGGVTVKYRGYCGITQLNRSEVNLFASKEEAQKFCDYSNMERKRISLADIIIQEGMKNTSPSPEKLKDRYEYYQKTGMFKKEILLDENNLLCDGYITYLICKMLDKTYVSVIIKK